MENHCEFLSALFNWKLPTYFSIMIRRVSTWHIVLVAFSHLISFRSVGVSHGRRDTMLKPLGGHFADKVVERVKGGRVFRGTEDNWDLKVLKGHMRKDVQNEDLHFFASNLIENRVNFSHLPNVHPKGDIANFARHHFFIECHWVEIVRKLCEDCVRILRCYEKWIAEIYVKAGLLDEEPQVDNLPLLEAPAAPGQTTAHRQETPDDQMREMKVVFAGDQLTQVRFAGAKDLLSSTILLQIVLNIVPHIKPVMWHTKASLLQYSFSFMYRAESGDQVGTLKYFREKYDRRNAALA